MGEFDDLIQDFLSESKEHIERLELDLVELEKNPKNKVALVCIFRSVHTVKGNCGFLGFPKLESLTHAAESLLSLLRDELIGLTEEMVNALLQLVDEANTILLSLEKTGKEGDSDPSRLIEIFNRLQKKQEDISSAPRKISEDAQALSAAEQELQRTSPAAGPQETVEDLAEDVFPLPQAGTESLLHTDHSVLFSNSSNASLFALERDTEHFDVESLADDSGDIEEAEAPIRAAKDSRETSLFGSPHDMLKVIGEPSSDEIPSSPSPSSPLITSGVYNYSDLIASLQTEKEQAPGQESVSLLGGEDKLAAAPPATMAPESVKPPIISDETRSPNAVDNTVRIDLALLDQMMNLIGELVLTRNQILQIAGCQNIAALTSPCQTLSTITGQLQERVMKTRMQPIDKLFKSFTRLVRNVSRLCKKIVLLDLQGGDTELDRSLVEAIKDPLMHVIRNAIDHGIEGPEQRLRKGKSREGRLLIKAFHESGQVHIQVRDDGAGINPIHLRKRLIERQLFSKEDIDKFDDTQIVSLIFMPGFTTTEAVTMVSGRGVGMDVVKANIESLGGKIQVQTMLGSWTSFTIMVPLTLAILPALIVSSQGQRFAIPQNNVQELLHIGDKHNLKIEEIHDSTVFRHRGGLLPLLDLGVELQGQAILTNETEKASLVILKSNEQSFGLIIDAVHDSQEIVVKALDFLLKNIPIYSAATILDDGLVALILDVSGLAQIVGLRDPQGEPPPINEDVAVHEEIQPMLIFGVGPSWRMAMPLEVVWRLEEVPLSKVEKLNQQLFIQHSDQLIPVIFLNEFFDLEADSSEDIDKDIVQLIICSWRGRHVGLIVDRVLDIAEESFQEQRHERKKGVYASAVIDGHATDLLDLREIIQRAHIMLLDNPEEARL
jgi:two-component system, chemotaxis family, sensor kinase CheA